MLREVLALAALLACTTAILAPDSGSSPGPRPRGMKTGGYQLVEDPKGEMFELALSKVLSEHQQLSREDLLKVESQVVAGMNYRFTFRGQNGEQTQYSTFVPLSALRKTSEQRAAPTKMMRPLKKRGQNGEETCRSILEDQGRVSSGAKLAKEKNSWLDSYSVAGAEECREGEVYTRLTFRGRQEQEAVFRVFAGRAREQVVLDQHLHASGYNRGQIEGAFQSLAQKIPSLKSFRLVEARTSLDKSASGTPAQLILKL